MQEATPDPDDEGVLSVHFGRSANCSSIGSVIDVLFVSGVVGTAVLASLAVLLGGRRVETDGAHGASARPVADADTGAGAERGADTDTEAGTERGADAEPGAGPARRASDDGSA